MNLIVKLVLMIKWPLVDYPMEMKMGDFNSDKGKAEYFML